MNAPITTLDSDRLLGRSGVRGSLMPLGTKTPGSDQRWGATDPDRQDVVAVGRGTAATPPPSKRHALGGETNAGGRDLDGRRCEGTGP
jgi:hypothetical protein